MGKAAALPCLLLAGEAMLRVPFEEMRETQAARSHPIAGRKSVRDDDCSAAAFSHPNTPQHRMTTSRATVQQMFSDRTLQGTQRVMEPATGTLRETLSCVGRNSVLLVVALFAFAASASGAEETFTLQTSDPKDLQLRTTPFLFVERLAFALDRRADNVFADQLRSFNMVKWSLSLNTVNDDFRDRTDSAAKGALSKSISHGFRDAIAESPFMLWLEDRQATLAAFLKDSIDSAEEEAVSPLDASYGLVEQSWWRNVRRNGALRFGLRPFRTSPYAFTSFAVRDGDEVLFLGHLRYYYDRLAEHRLELATSIPLVHGYILDVGTSYRPLSGEAPARFAVKVFKELRIGGIAHLGFELKERPVILAGLTFPL